MAVNIFGRENCELANGTCTACCWALEIPRVTNRGEVCQHVVPKGCNLHGTPLQPRACRTRCENINKGVKDGELMIRLIIAAASINPGITPDEKDRAELYLKETFK